MLSRISGKFNRCPPGKVQRRSYTRKNGKRVKSTCVKGPKHHTKSYTEKLRCPPGYIARSSYVRKISTRVKREGYNKHTKLGNTVRVYPKAQRIHVKSTCVKDEGIKVIDGVGLKKKNLKKYGYSYKLSDDSRRTALKAAVNGIGPRDIYKKLDTLARLSSTVVPEASQIFSRDRNWVRSTYL